jgi:predicted nucleic acid-binding protein
MRAYIDSDVLIWHLRGDPRAETLLRTLSSEEGTDLWIGALQRAEVVFFMRPNEQPATLSFLSRFKTAPVTQQIVDDGAVLYRKYHPTHGTDVNDAILAATAMTTGGKIYTLNARHYPMPDQVVIRAWKA